MRDAPRVVVVRRAELAAQVALLEADADRDVGGCRRPRRAGGRRSWTGSPRTRRAGRASSGAVPRRRANVATPSPSRTVARRSQPPCRRPRNSQWSIMNVAATATTQPTAYTTQTSSDPRLGVRGPTRSPAAPATARTAAPAPGWRPARRCCAPACSVRQRVSHCLNAVAGHHGVLDGEHEQQTEVDRHGRPAGRRERFESTVGSGPRSARKQHAPDGGGDEGGVAAAGVDAAAATELAGCACPASSPVRAVVSRGNTALRSAAAGGVPGRDLGAGPEARGGRGCARRATRRSAR